MNIDIDDEYECVRVSKVEPSENGWYVLRDDGWSLWVTSENCQQAPVPGEEMRCYGRGIGYEVRGIAINGRVYRYRTPQEHEVARLAMVERLTREREESDRKFREAAKSRTALPAFAVTDAAEWAKCVELNSRDPYSYECVRYAAAWANLMETRGADARVSDIAEECSRLADTSGITGFMYGAAVSMLARFWARGDELRRWHNKETQVGDEGDRANESGGVLNPAILSIGGGE